MMPFKGFGALAGMEAQPRSCREPKASSCPMAWPLTSGATCTSPTPMFWALYHLPAPSGVLIAKRRTSTLWLQDWAILGGLGGVPGYPPLGANGIAFGDDGLYVASTERGLIVACPGVARRQAWRPSVVAQAPSLRMIDGIALDVHGDNLRGPHWPGPRRGGRSCHRRCHELAGPGRASTDRRAWPLEPERGERKNLYFTNYAIFTQAHPGVLKMEVEMPGLPLP